MSLLILFNPANYNTEGGFNSPSIPQPSLPDLHIKDSLTREDIPVGGVKGWDEDYIQTIAVHKAPLKFQLALSNGVADTYTASFWCKRLSSLVVNMLFTDNTAQCSYRVLLSDDNNVYAVSELHTIVPTIIQKNNLWIGEMKTHDLFGASYVGLYIESVTNGTIDVYLAGV